MNRILLAAGVGVLVLLALWHPVAPAALTVAAPAPRPHRHSERSLRRARLNASIAVVYVAGAVKHPGLYRVDASARVDDAVRIAGGFRSDADPEAVNLAEHIADGEEIRVTRIGEATPRPLRKHRARRRKKRVMPQAALDLNSADEAALSQLPGLGQTLAERIVAYRRTNGPFASLDELADVAGMTQRRIDAISPYLTVHDGS